MLNKPHILKTVFRWVFNILCLLVVSFLFLVGVWAGNLNFLWLIIQIVLWVAAFKRKTAGWLALGFLATIIVIIVWLFMPDSGNWRPYNFDYELKDFEAKRAIPDAENAAIAYRKFFASFDVNNAPPFYEEDCNGASTSVPWKGSDHPDVAAFVDARINFITDAMIASAMEKCAFSIYTDPLNFSFEPLNGIRQIAYLLRSAGNRDVGEGRIDEALEKYNCLFRIGHHLEKQPTIVYFLTGIAIENLGFYGTSIAIVAADPCQTQFDNLRQLLPPTKDDWPQLWAIMSEYETMFTKNAFAMAYEINDKGEIRFRRNDIPLNPEMAKLTEYKPTAFDRKMTKLAAIVYWFILPQDPHELATSYDKSLEEAMRTADANEVDYGSANLVLDYTLCPRQSLIKRIAKSEADSCAQVHQIYLRTIVYRRTMHILLALREYKDANGRWPDSLDQIKDKVPAEAMIYPFTGGSFIYKVKGDKFLLYSVGPNKIDERCMSRPKGVSWDQAKGKFDDILIWPQKKEQAKEFFDPNTPVVK